MIHWLAEQYVIAWSKTVFFLQNPTSCQWIDFFQAAGVLVGAGWILRTACLTFRGHRVSHLSIAVKEHPDLEASRKLAAAFSRAREHLRREIGAHRIDEGRLRILSSGEALLCNVGILAPTVLISPALIRKLSKEELTAALAHELTHVLRKDNLKRVLLEAACLLAPMAFWMCDSIHLAVSSRAEFLAVLFMGLLAGLAIRTLLVPAITYWQERRADEWAALAAGDRLTVASALVATAAASSQGSRRLVPFPATSFAFYNAPVSSRVRRLIECDDASVLMRLDQIMKGLFRVGIPALVLLAALAVNRAESEGLAGVIQITSRDVSIHVEPSMTMGSPACLRLAGRSGGG